MVRKTQLKDPLNSLALGKNSGLSGDFSGMRALGGAADNGSHLASRPEVAVAGHVDVIDDDGALHEVRGAVPTYRSQFVPPGIGE